MSRPKMNIHPMFASSLKKVRREYEGPRGLTPEQREDLEQRKLDEAGLDRIAEFHPTKGLRTYRRSQNERMAQLL